MAKVVMYAKTQEDLDKLMNTQLDNCVVLSPEFFESIFPWGSEMQGRVISDAKVFLAPSENEFRIHYFLESHLDKEEIEPFCKWAFGKDYLKLANMSEYLLKWNKLHGNDYTISIKSAITPEAEIMVKLYQGEGIKWNG